jgi:PST family polysaccharide transporter
MLEKLRLRIISSKDGRALVSNLGYLSLLQIASYIFPLITVPYLARVIGTVGFGKVAFASAVITWFISIVTWGFDYTATRDVARDKDDIDKISETFSNVFWTRFFLTVICLAILILLIVLIPKFKANASVLLVTFLLVLGHVMFPEWLFQALERMRYITILNLLSKILFTIAVFLFVKEPSDYILQPFFLSLGYILSGIMSMYIILVRWGVKLRLPSLRLIFETLKNGLDVFVNNFVSNLYNNLSIVILGFYSGNIANGLFDAGQKFIDVAIRFLNILSRAFFPFLSRRIDKHNLYAILNISVGVFSSLLLFIFAPLLIKWFYTPDFIDAITVLRVLAISIVFLCMNNVYGVNYLILQGHEIIVRNISVVCSVAGLFLAFILIPKLSFVGAAITILISRASTGLLIMFNAIRIKRINNF